MVSLLYCLHYPNTPAGGVSDLILSHHEVTSMRWMTHSVMLTVSVIPNVIMWQSAPLAYVIRATAATALWVMDSYSDPFGKRICFALSDSRIESGALSKNIIGRNGWGAELRWPHQLQVFISARRGRCGSVSEGSGERELLGSTAAQGSAVWVSPWYF